MKGVCDNVKYMGMNILEYIDYLMAEYGMSEEDAEREADCAFNLCEDE